MQNRFTADRRNQLAQLIISKGSLTISEAAKKFNVSTETIRKDFIWLEHEGLITKSRGGAMPAAELLEKPVIQKKAENADSKNRIARKALDYVPKNGIVLLDAGTTTFALARLIALESGLSVFTNSSQNLNILAESQNNVFILGGQIRPSSLAVIGPWANEQLACVHADVAFIGTDGFCGANGPSTMAYAESEIKKTMLKSSRQRIVLADSSKFRNCSSFQFGRWDEIEVLITDIDISESELATIPPYTKVITV